MQDEAAITEVDHLPLASFNPLIGWQDDGQAQAIAMQSVAKVSQEPPIAQGSDQPLQDQEVRS